jgi:hypothetical protein
MISLSETLPPPPVLSVLIGQPSRESARPRRGQRASVAVLPGGGDSWFNKMSESDGGGCGSSEGTKRRRGLIEASQAQP